MTSALEESKESVSNILFLTTVGAGWKGWWGLPHSWSAFSFTPFAPPHCGKEVLSHFLPLLGSLCMKRNTCNDKPRLQVPCRGWRPAQTAAALLLPPPLPLAWWNERMHVSPSFQCPRVVQPLPSFIFVKFCELFLNHLSCLCAGFLRRNSTVQRANPFRVCGRQGREMWRKVL